MTERDARSALCRTGRRLYRLGLVAGTAGNFSLCLPAGTGESRKRAGQAGSGEGARGTDASGVRAAQLLVTPRGAHKGRLSPEDLVSLPLTDPPEAAVREATSELPLHLAIYRSAPSVCAVLHTHAPCLTAAGIRGLSMESDLPEIEGAVGPVRTVPFAPSGTRELGRAAASEVEDGATVLVLRRHGAVAVGQDLEEAENRMELAELAARTLLLARG